MATEQTLVERHVSTVGAALTAASVIVGCVVYFAQIGPHLTNLDGKISELSARADNQTARVDQIEASRTIGLQRLATAEEAVKGVKDYLAKIDAKVDRLLMRGR